MTQSVSPQNASLPRRKHFLRNTSLLAAGSLLFAGCDQSSQLPGQGALRDSAIRDSALPTKTLEVAQDLGLGMYEVPASRLKDWSLKFTRDNPDKFIASTAVSSIAVVEKSPLTNYATAYTVPTGVLVFTYPKADFRGIPRVSPER